MRAPSTLLVGLALLLTAPLRAADDPGTGSVVPPAFVLDNGVVRAAFSSDQGAGGTLLELTSLRNLVHQPALAPIDLAPGSGAWRLRFVVEDTAAEDWVELAMDGSTDASAPGLGSLQSLTLEGVQLGLTQLEARWSASLTVAGESADLTVTTRWTLLSAEPALDTHIEVDVLQSPLGFYLSEVVHPRLRVTAYDTPDEALLLPWINGCLVRDPTDPALPFKVSLGSGSNHFPLNVAAYYDGAAESRCLAVASTDLDEVHKDLWVSVGQQGATRHVQFEPRHIPSDVFDANSYVQPYQVRLGALEGDWWDVAEAYRQLLAQAPWYHGPVGSPAHPMPAAGKDRIAEVFLQPGYEGDNMDLLSRSAVAMSRVLGSRVHTVYYGASAPDRFDEWYFSGGYLPGRPSLVGAVQTGQAQLDHRVSLYVNGTAAADYSDPALDPPISEPTPEQQAAFDSFLLREDGQPGFFEGFHAPPRVAYLCTAAPWWRDELPAMLRELATVTGMGGAYLDFFLTGPCYARDHDHAPGGGSWMYTERMEQLREIKAPPHEELLLPIEFLHGRFTEEVHLMHADPASNLLSAVNHPGTLLPAPMANATVVPFFKAVHDNVRMSRITAQFPSDSGRRAWTEATCVFGFGQIPGLVRPLAELTPVFSERYRFAPYYTDLVDEAFGNGGGGTLPLSGPGTLPGETIDTAPPKEAVNVPYLRYLGTLTGVLRQHGFLTWHNGTLRRLPDWEILSVTPPDFDGVPGLELEVDDAYQRQSPAEVEEWLVPGLFQAPPDLGTADAGSLAFVLTNPWVDPFRSATFQAGFVLDPAEYPGWDGSTTYGVTVHTQDGGVVTLPGSFSGPFDLTAVVGPATLAPGDVRWWVFRQLGGPGGVGGD